MGIFTKKPAVKPDRVEELRGIVGKIKGNISLYGFYGLTTLLAEERRALRHYERLLVQALREAS